MKKNMEIQFAIEKCSLGSTLVAKSAKGICAIFMDDDHKKLIHHLQKKFPRANLVSGDKQFKQIMEQVIRFIEAPKTKLNIALDIQGTTFQQRVWKALQKIPFGKTVSYTEIANQIGSPLSVRAVANACGANALAVVIPCHRVVKMDGSISGYRWGIDRKQMLLENELKYSS